MTAQNVAPAPADLENLVVRPHVHVRIRNLSGTIVVAVDEATRELADTAEDIWRATAPGRTVRQVAAVVADLYGESVETVLPDVTEWVVDMYEAGFLTLRKPEGPVGA